LVLTIFEVIGVYALNASFLHETDNLRINMNSPSTTTRPGVQRMGNSKHQQMDVSLGFPLLYHPMDPSFVFGGFCCLQNVGYQKV